jgi:hypothetical protein
MSRIFAHGACYAQEFKVVPALKHFIGLFGKIIRQGKCKIMCFLFQDSSLVGSGLDLVEQHVAGPPKLGSGTKVVDAGGGIGNLGKKIDMMPSWNRCDQFSHSL